MEMGRQRPQNLFPDPWRLEDMFYEGKPLCPSEEVNSSFTIIGLRIQTMWNNEVAQILLSNVPISRDICLGYRNCPEAVKARTGVRR